jgi:hypothetical protein
VSLFDIQERNTEQRMMNRLPGRQSAGGIDQHPNKIMVNGLHANLFSILSLRDFSILLLHFMETGFFAPRAFNPSL